MPITTLQDIIDIARICGGLQERIKDDRWHARIANDEATRARYESYIAVSKSTLAEYDGYLTAAVARFRNA